MAIQKMKFVRAFGNTQELDSFIINCCIDGNFQPENALSYAPKGAGYTAFSEKNPYADALQMINELSEELGVKTDVASDFELNSSEADIEFLVEFHDTIHENYTKRSELQKELENNKTLVENYEHFDEMDINLKDIFECKFAKFRFGYLPRESYEKLQLDIYRDNPFVNFIKGKEVKDGYWGAYVVPVSEKPKVDSIFKKLSFEKAFVPAYNGSAEQAIQDIKDHNTEIEARIAALTSELSEYIEKEKSRYSVLCANLTVINTVFEMKYNAAVKPEDNEFMFTGWITADGEDEFLKKAAKTASVSVECETPGAALIKKIPIKLKNNKLFAPFSYFVEMFGLPSYNELDPTPLFAITYSLMFGLMFADLGQGLAVIIIGFLMNKFKKMPLGKILMRCGVFSMLFGAVFGSVFGTEDLLDPIYKSIGLTGLPIKVFENTTGILIFAISAGILLMLTVMIINTVCSFKLKRFADAVFSANGIAGILTYSSAVFFATNFMANDELKAVLSAVPSSVPTALIVIGLVMMFMHEYVKEKSEDKNYKPQIGNYILSNFIELFESILSFFSNTVSYLRLGAFVLVHAGMMMVVTTLAGNTVNVTYIIVMILGNALVIALEALLTGIQSLRLEFYEMFSRYYTGQGVAFKPVSIKN